MMKFNVECSHICSPGSLLIVTAYMTQICYPCFSVTWSFYSVANTSSFLFEVDSGVISCFKKPKRIHASTKISRKKVSFSVSVGRC